MADKAVFLSGDITFNSVTYKLTSMDYQKRCRDIDVTDLSNTLNTSDFVADKVEVSFTAEMWKHVDVANPPIGTEYSLSADFEGFTVSGNGIITNIGINAVFDTVVKLTISGKFNDSITETPAT